MWAVYIVVDPPFFDDLAGMPIAGEEPLVEALIAHPAAKAFHQAVLHRLARRDVVPFDLPVFLPCQHGIRGQLGAVVRHEGYVLGDHIEAIKSHIFRMDDLTLRALEANLPSKAPAGSA